MDILKLTSGLSNDVFGAKSDDDFSDRLNYRYTVALLMFFTLILTTRQYSSEVIRCWVPAHFKPSYEAYVSQICWVQNTYFFAHDQALPKDIVEREKNQIKYYQWVSFVLLLQAFMFYLPRIFWNTFSSKCGLSISDLIQAADKYKSADKYEKKEAYMDYMVQSIHQLLNDQRRDEKTKNAVLRLTMALIPCFGRFEGNYMIILYIMTKLIYIGNAILQINIISGFLGQSFWIFGYNFIVGLTQGEGWTVSNSEYFPKVTLCDFMIREIGNPNKSHRYTVQCVLPINLFNQQIFTAIWFWYLIVLCWNVVNFVNWLKKTFPNNAKNFIKRRTNLFNELVNLKKVPHRFDHFIQKYLEADGIFIVRMIGNNTSDYVATDLIHQLWCQHDDHYGHMFPNEPHQSCNTCKFKHKHEIKQGFVKGVYIPNTPSVDQENVTLLKRNVAMENDTGPPIVLNRNQNIFFRPKMERVPSLVTSPALSL